MSRFEHIRSGEQGFSQKLKEKVVAAGSKISHNVRGNLKAVLPAAVFMAANGCAQIIGIEDWHDSNTSSNAASTAETSSGTGGMGGGGGKTVSSSESSSTSSVGGQGGMGGVGGMGGAGGGPAENVTFDTAAMGCFKPVIVDDVTKKVVSGSASADTCPTELSGIYVPPNSTMVVWVKDPANNLLSFNSAEGFTISKARCSTYPTAPTWTQIESDYATQTFGSISNAATPPGYLFTKSCANDAEYWIHK